MKATLRKIMIALIGAAVLATAAGVAVVALAMALYGLLEPMVGGPGAAALLALAAAIVLAVVGLALERWILQPRHPHAAKPARGGEDHDVMGRLIGLARERPVVATGALIGGLFLAMRNPAVTALVVKAVLDQKRPTKKA